MPGRLTSGRVPRRPSDNGTARRAMLELSVMARLRVAGFVRLVLLVAFGLGLASQLAAAIATPMQDMASGGFADCAACPDGGAKPNADSAMRGDCPVLACVTTAPVPIGTAAIVPVAFGRVIFVAAPPSTGLGIFVAPALHPPRAERV
jgi:hypothetical protein